MIKETYTYKNENDQLCVLTDDCIKWFKEQCERVKFILHSNINIICYDMQEKPDMFGQSLACMISMVEPKKRKESSCCIVLDNFFIDCCFREEERGYNVCFDNIVHVLCHELAHLKYWRHTKKHADLTEEYYKKVISSV